VYEVSYGTTFCATHRLTDRGTPIEPLHGHDWRVEEVLGEVAGRFHYRDLNEHPDFAGRSVSAEVLARYFFDEVGKGLGDEGRSLVRVRVWEAPGCTATYRP
jgi:6-pyruvoyl-tetrahydropterin synthase